LELKIWDLVEAYNISDVLSQIYKPSKFSMNNAWTNKPTCANMTLKLNIFPFSASILTFSTQNHLILTYFTHLDTPIFSTNTIISTVSAIRKSKWIISSNKASYEVNIHVNAKLFISSWRTRCNKQFCVHVNGKYLILMKITKITECNRVPVIALWKYLSLIDWICMLKSVPD
jgi:hypothetical protein